MSNNCSPQMKIAVSCAMNQNRSMQTHEVFLKKGIQISSFGTNNVIKLPGETMDNPNIYNFGCTYKEMHDDLCIKNEKLYRESGLLYLLERNMSIKEKPENFFQRTENFDLVITCEEKVFTSIFNSNNTDGGKGIYFVVNFDIKDTPSDAIIGANEVLSFVEDVLSDSDKEMEVAISNALEKYYKRTGTMLLFSVIHS